MTVPARTYYLRGERRTYALLRGNDEAITRLRAAVLEAYEIYERDKPELTPAA